MTAGPSVLVEPLPLQNLVAKREIRLMRRLRRKGFTVKKIAETVKRSPTTVRHYLKSNERMT